MMQVINTVDPPDRMTEYAFANVGANIRSVHDAAVARVPVLIASHLPDDRRYVIFVSGLIPRHDAANLREHCVGLRQSVIIRDVIEQLIYVAASDFEEWTILPSGVHIFGQD